MKLIGIRIMFDDFLICILVDAHAKSNWSIKFETFISNGFLCINGVNSKQLRIFWGNK